MTAPNPSTNERAVRVCVPVSERKVGDLPLAIERAAAGADLVEVRLDYLPPENIDAGKHSLLEKTWPVPLIVTLRPVEQGGQIELTLAQRRGFWQTPPNAGFLFDWELDLAESFAASEVGPAWDQIICSHHDFQGVPSDLDQLVRRMLATPARILKLAVAANKITDNLTVFCQLETARAANREMIAIAMNESGVLTRVVASAWGSYLTYAAEDAESRSAPGQLTVAELLDRYRVRSVNRETEVFGIMGQPVAHSLSPVMHNSAFAGQGRNAVFLPLPVTECASFLRRMVHPKTREWPLNWRGLSVTAPHKRAVMALLDRVAPVAEEIGAVNTIVVQGDGLHGYNTDADGFIAPLAARFINLRGLRCAVLGAGGAARAAVWSLQRSGALTTVFARHPDRARLLGREFAADFDELAGASLAGFDLVVNATPLGSRGELEDQTPVTAGQLKGVRMVYDLIYNPAMTAFLRAGEAAGCSTLGGMEMLVAQAAVQFKLWTGEDGPVKLMRVAAENVG